VLVQVPFATVSVVPFFDNGFYRLILNTSSLYQNPNPLVAQIAFTTAIRYPFNAGTAVSVPIWIYPQTPPNYLNPISNLSFLAPN
jgi:hypothetical protein